MRTQLRVTPINRDISEFSCGTTVTNTLANVRNAYWDLVFAHGSRRRRGQRSLQLADKLVEDNKIRVEVGTLAPIDVVQAEAEAATRRQALAQLEAQAQTAELPLKRLIVSGTDDPAGGPRLNPTDRPSLQNEPHRPRSGAGQRARKPHRPGPEQAQPRDQRGQPGAAQEPDDALRQPGRQLRPAGHRRHAAEPRRAGWQRHQHRARRLRRMRWPSCATASSPRGTSRCRSAIRSARNPPRRTISGRASRSSRAARSFGRLELNDRHRSHQRGAPGRGQLEARRGLACRPRTGAAPARGRTEQVRGRSLDQLLRGAGPARPARRREHAAARRARLPQSLVDFERVQQTSLRNAGIHRNTRRRHGHRCRQRAPGHGNDERPWQARRRQPAPDTGIPWRAEASVDAEVDRRTRLVVARRRRVLRVQRGGGAAGKPAGGTKGGPPGAFAQPPMTVELAGQPRRRCRTTSRWSAAWSARRPSTSCRVRRDDCRSIGVRFGDPVTRGQLLANVEDRELREQLRQAEASFEVAQATIRQREADLSFAKTNLERTRASSSATCCPASRSTTPRRAIRRRRPSSTSRRRSWRRPRRAVDELRIKLANTTVTSPVNGFVGQALRRSLAPSSRRTRRCCRWSTSRIVRLVVNLVERDLRRVGAGAARRRRRLPRRTVRRPRRPHRAGARPGDAHGRDGDRDPERRRGASSPACTRASADQRQEGERARRAQVGVGRRQQDRRGVFMVEKGQAVFRAVRPRHRRAAPHRDHRRTHRRR